MLALRAPRAWQRQLRSLWNGITIVAVVCALVCAVVAAVFWKNQSRLRFGSANLKVRVGKYSNSVVGCVFPSEASYHENWCKNLRFLFLFLFVKFFAVNCWWARQKINLWESKRFMSLLMEFTVSADDMKPPDVA